MIYTFLYPWLVELHSGFNVLRYTSIRVAYAAVTSLLISILLGPLIIKMLKRLKAGQEVRSDGPESHLVKQGTPTMGGLMIIIGIAVSIILWMDVANPITWMMVTALLGYGLIGAIDDLLKITKKNSAGLSSGMKMMMQLILASILLAWNYMINGEGSTELFLPFFKDPVLNMGLFYFPLAMVLMVGTTNAVNLTDGLDGLVSGLLIIVGLAFAVISYVSGHIELADYLNIPHLSGGHEMTIFALALVGGVVGFLWFNTHPAEVFMGDTGSLSMGGVLGLMAILLKKEILLIVLGGVFVLETLSVIIQVFWFKTTGKRVFKMSPLHHHFELSGWSETKVVTRFWILGGLFAILAISTLKLQ
jgi:phospho-N-acetylmuramoyl-pentapeptide-transferase